MSLKVTEKRINDLCVKPIKLSTILTPEHIKGYDMFSEIYSNIFACAKKKMGKTNVTFTILRECCGPYLVDDHGVHRTKLWICCSTVEKDDNWKAILKWADKRGFEYELFDDVNELNHIAEELCKPKPEETKEVDPLSLYRENQKKERKRTYVQPERIAPENIFIFDDMSKALRKEAVSTFLKKNRHFKSKMIISSQYPNDLDVPGRKQLNYWLLFKGHSEEKLKEIYHDMDLNVTYESFKRMYEYATNTPFSFLYVDVNCPEFRKGFNTQLSVEGAQ
jgi:hypothetical protein